MRTWLRLVVVLGLLVPAACTHQAPGPVTIDVDAPVALADRAIHLRITGLDGHQRVTVRAEAVDYQGATWHSQIDVAADAHGVVDLDHAAPIDGDYHIVDGMGLFWSMTPPTGDPEGQFFAPLAPELQSGYQVHITVTARGRSIAARTLVRQWLGPGEKAQAFSVALDKVDGELYLPPPGPARHPAVLVFGGSDGGNGLRFTAALLAAHGYPALSIAYFHDAGLPDTLASIPIEYFATAARLLARQPGVDPAHILALTASRGTEAALLLAQDYPDLVHGAVLYAPSAQINPGLPDQSQPAWTWHGVSVPFEFIPVDRISGPVLAIAGADDQLWTSATWAPQIIQELDAAHNAYPHRALVYPGAGHLVGTFPYVARGIHPYYSFTDSHLVVGGTRAADAAAQRDGWPRVLALLGSV